MFISILNNSNKNNGNINYYLLSGDFYFQAWKSEYIFMESINYISKFYYVKSDT